MKFLKKYIILILIITNNLTAHEQPYSEYLQNRIPEENFRHNSFLLALKLMSSMDAKVIVETGTARGGLQECLSNGCSTLIFAHWASDNNAVVYSVDINEDAIKVAENCVEQYSNHVQFIHSDSVQLLSNFNQPIDFLYLDSYDYDINNPRPSQLHHLKEIKAAYPWLHEKSIIMIDDCNLPKGGKGKLVINYLKKRNWKVIFSNYQVILSR